MLVHVAIEAEAGRALQLATELVDAAAQQDAALVERLLIDMNGVWDRMNGHFDRMPERCDPYIYYQRVRPYIHGWKNNPAMPAGLIYEGVAKYAGKPQSFRGQTGSQSSIVPAMDGLFQVVHESDPLREFLDELHQYRPPKHRAFIEAVRDASSLARLCKDAKPIGQGRLQRLRRTGRAVPHPASGICGELYQQTGLIGRWQRYRCRHRRHAFHEISEKAPRRKPRADDLIHSPVRVERSRDTCKARAADGHLDDARCERIIPDLFYASGTSPSRSRPTQRISTSPATMPSPTASPIQMPTPCHFRLNASHAPTPMPTTQ